MVLETIFNSDLGQGVLVFLLVFTVVFAILQKSEILGKGKSQVDALVALAIGLLVISVGYATDIIRQLIPFLGVSLVVILVFLLLVGIFYKQGEFALPSGVVIAFGILAFIAVVIAVLSITGSWSIIEDYFDGKKGGTLIPNLALLLVVAGAVWLAMKGGGKE